MAQHVGSVRLSGCGAERGKRVLKSVHKVARHCHWAITQGVGRLVEEDQLNPVVRAGTAKEKARWRRANPRPAGHAAPIFVVGLQRSGTNMLVRGLERAPEVEVHNENDRRAFSNFRLRSDDVVCALIEQSRHDYVLFKPLCDSHRTVELLALPTATAGQAIWVFRQVDNRVRSSVAKFGNSNLLALRAIAGGQTARRWEAGGLSPQSLALLRDLPLGSLSAESGSALLWCIRNEVFFTQALDRRPDVSLVSYDRFVADPAGVMSALCGKLGISYRPSFVEGIRAQGTAGRARLDLHPRVRQLCEQMQARLDAVLLTTPSCHE